jgi:hypothetical protein
MVAAPGGHVHVHVDTKYFPLFLWFSRFPDAGQTLKEQMRFQKQRLNNDASIHSDGGDTTNVGESRHHVERQIGL